MELNVGDVFQSRKELMALGLHSKPMAGMSTTKDADGISFVNALVASGYPDNQSLGTSDLFYAAEGGFDMNLGKMVKDQDLSIKVNKSLLTSLQKKYPIKYFKKLLEDNKSVYRFEGDYIATHYQEIRGVNGYKVYRFHLKKRKEFDNLKVTQESVVGLLEKSEVASSGFIRKKHHFVSVTKNHIYGRDVHLLNSQSSDFSAMLDKKIKNYIEFEGKRMMIFTILN